MVGKVDGGGYLSVGQRGVHAGNVQVTAVVRTLAPVGWHEGWHPAAVGVTQGLALLCAVGEKVSPYAGSIDEWMESGDEEEGNARMEMWMRDFNNERDEK